MTLQLLHYLLVVRFTPVDIIVDFLRQKVRIERHVPFKCKNTVGRLMNVQSTKLFALTLRSI